LLILVAVAVSSGNATVRKVFDLSSNAWLELQWISFSAVFLLCAPWTLLTTEHIRIDSLSKVFHSKRGNLVAIDRVSLGIPEGQFCCIVGPSGCGKTTLLNILAGLDTPSEGAVIVDNQAAPEIPKGGKLEPIA